jgi:hypothetical protein
MICTPTEVDSHFQLGNDAVTNELRGWLTYESSTWYNVNDELSQTYSCEQQ